MAGEDMCSAASLPGLEAQLHTDWPGDLGTQYNLSVPFFPHLNIRYAEQVKSVDPGKALTRAQCLVRAKKVHTMMLHEATDCVSCS